MTKRNNDRIHYNTFICTFCWFNVLYQDCKILQGYNIFQQDAEVGVKGTRAAEEPWSPASRPNLANLPGQGAT